MEEKLRLFFNEGVRSFKIGMRRFLCSLSEWVVVGREHGDYFRAPQAFCAGCTMFRCGEADPSTRISLVESVFEWRDFTRDTWKSFLSTVYTDRPKKVEYD